MVKNEELENLHDKLRNSLRIIKTMLSESKFGDTHRNAHLDGNFYSFLGDKSLKFRSFIQRIQTAILFHVPGIGNGADCHCSPSALH